MAEPTIDTMDPAAETPKLRLLNPRDVRKEAEMEVDLGDGTMVRARKLDGRGAGGAGRGLATVEAGRLS